MWGRDNSFIRWQQGRNNKNNLFFSLLFARMFEASQPHRRSSKCVYLDVLRMVIISRGSGQHPAPAVCNAVKGEGYSYICIYTHSHRAIVLGCQKASQANVPISPSCRYCPGKRGCVLMPMAAPAKAVIGLGTRYYRQERSRWKRKDQISLRWQWKCMSKAGTEPKSPVSQASAFLRRVAFFLDWAHV